MGTSSPPGTLASDLGTTERLSTTRPRTTGDDDAYDNDDNGDTSVQTVRAQCSTVQTRHRTPGK